MTPEQQRVIEWLANGRTGASSKTIAFWLGFGVRTRDASHPHDPDDLDRCLQLLTFVPEMRPHLHKMAELSPYWAALIPLWEEVESCHLGEVGLMWSKGHKAPKTYALMAAIFAPVEREDSSIVARFGNSTLRTS